MPNIVYVLTNPAMPADAVARIQAGRSYVRSIASIRQHSSGRRQRTLHWYLRSKSCLDIP